MREILFRGKNKRNGKWIIGDLVTNFELAGNYGIRKSNSVHTIAVREDTIGQFTGMTDKDGNKIFEGDVIEYYNSITNKTSRYTIESRIDTRNGVYDFTANKHSELADSGISLSLFSKDKTKVVGNIYDKEEA